MQHQLCRLQQSQYHASIVRAPDMNMIANLNKEELMIDSGAATHVCPFWFASTTPTYDIPEHVRPNLRTATEDPIKVYGYKWVYMTNESNQQIVIPFYVCWVSQPILSVTRLTEQGFTIHLSEQPTITHLNGFEAKLRAKEGTYFLPVNNTGTPPNYKLDVHETQQGIKATVSPITLTPEGTQWVKHQHDIWTYNGQGYLVRLHKAKRRATYMPDQQCPVPMDKLEDYRRTIAHKQDETTEDFVEQLHSLDHSKQKRKLDIAWKGETWFKVKKDARPPQPPIATQDTSSRALPLRRSQRGLRRWQQATSNSRAVHNNHAQQQAFQDRRRFQQQRTIGHEKDICGKESTYSPEQSLTYHNRHRMDQTWRSWFLIEQQWSDQHQEQMVPYRIDDDWLTSNIERPIDWLNKLWGECLIQRWDTWCGWNNIHNKQSQQENLQHQHSQHSKSEQNMSSHAFHSGVGVQHDA